MPLRHSLVRSILGLLCFVGVTHAEQEVVDLKGETLQLDSFKVEDVTIQGPGVIAAPQGARHALLVGSNVTLKNITFKTVGGLSANDDKGASSDIYLLEGAENITIQNCHFESSGYYCAITADVNCVEPEDLTYLKPVKNLTIDNCVFDGNFKYYRQLYLFSTHHVKVTACDFFRPRYDAIRLRLNTEDVLIDDCFFVFIGNGDPEGKTKDAVDMAVSGRKVVISNCVIDGVSSVGLDLKGERTDEVAITKNVIRGCQVGIVISANATQKTPIDKVFVIENRIELCGLLREEATGGILVKGGTRNVVIRGNVVADCLGRGVSIIAAHGPNLGLIVRDNIITRCVAGELTTAGAAADSFIRGNRITPGNFRRLP